MCIVTGPNIEIATKLIKRLKGIFATKLGLTFNDKETHLQLNGYSIEVLYADEFERPRYEDMINKVADMYNSFTNIKNIFVGASSPELISSLKREVANERDNWLCSGENVKL